MTRVLPLSVQKTGDLTPQPPLQLRFAAWRGGARKQALSGSPLSTSGVAAKLERSGGG